MKNKKTIERAQKILDKSMSLKEKDASNPYWIEGTDDNDYDKLSKKLSKELYDEHPDCDYCSKCVVERTEQIRKFHRGEIRENIRSSGGWSMGESESPMSCAKCGDRLNYSLNNPEAELEHFESHSDFDIKQNSYELSVLLEYYDYTEQEYKSRILKIAEKIIRGKNEYQ